MSDNECESVDGWNNGEGEEWSDEEPDIDNDIVETINIKLNKYQRYPTFSEDDGSCKEDSDTDKSYSEENEEI
jgi:hypothetical protein